MGVGVGGSWRLCFARRAAGVRERGSGWRGKDLGMPRFTIGGVEYLSTKDAADLLGVAPNTLRAYIKKSVLEDVPFQRVGTRK